MSYNLRGDITEALFFGPDGQPEAYGECFVGSRIDYDKQGRKIQHSWFDRTDNLVSNPQGCARETYVYDAQGNITEVTCFDERGQLTLRQGGYAKTVRTYDTRNNLETEALLDTEGQPTQGEDGYHKVRYTYDERGFHTGTAYYDTHGNLTLQKDGYAREQGSYNDNGKITEVTFFGLDNAPVLTKKFGYAKMRLTYNKKGKVSQLSYFGPDDRPVQTTAGYATIRYFYDDLGRENKREFYNINGGIVRTLVTVDEVEPDTKGEQIGLRVGDMILSYDGEEVTDNRVFEELELEKGERRRKLRLQRDGRVISLNVPPGRIKGITYFESVPQ